MLEKIKGNVTAYWCVEYTGLSSAPASGFNILIGIFAGIYTLQLKHAGALKSVHDNMMSSSTSTQLSLKTSVITEPSLQHPAD